MYLKYFTGSPRGRIQRLSTFTVLAFSSFSTAYPLNCKLCPSELLPDDGHDLCPLCLDVQHLKEALMDPCPHCSLLPMPERQLRLAGLDHNQDAEGL